MSTATTVLKQTTTTSARMSSNIHCTELSTLNGINLDKFNSENLCTTKQLPTAIEQQHQHKTYMNKQQKIKITNNNNNININNSSDSSENKNRKKSLINNQYTSATQNSGSGILMESKSNVNVMRKQYSDNDRRRHSFLFDDERLLKILSAPPDEPLYINSPNQLNGDKVVSNNGNLLMQYEAAATTVAATSSIVSADDYENQPPHDKRTIATNHEDGETMSSTPQKFFSPATWNKIQRDLNSPSASCRVRALRAMKSPVHSSYYNRSEDPQICEKTTEEDKTTIPDHPKTIQEVMKNVSVYVEIRSATDNRTAGVKSVIAQLGAKVMERLTKNTTHVVFKDGLQTTYNKAKSLNIPIVSILWIEACKRHLVLMDPKDFPISNLDAYENPDLYPQPVIPKRHKYIQNSETLMKNLHRKIPKSKLLQELKKMDESKNATNDSKTLSTTPKIVQSKRLSTSLKANTSRKSMTANKAGTTQKNTILSMFGKQIEKSQMENSQMNKSSNGELIDKANDDELMKNENLANNSTASEHDMSTVEEANNVQINDEPIKEIVTDETILITGNLHNRLTRRNSICISTPTKTSPTKQTPKKTGPNASTPLMTSARKRLTLFTPTINATIEECDQNTAQITKKNNESMRNKTINNSVPMEICANSTATTKCNSQARQLLDAELSKSLARSSITTPKQTATDVMGNGNLLKSTLRRRTVFTPQPMDETKVRGSLITPISSPRRKTIMPKSASASTRLNGNPPDTIDTKSCDAVLTPTNSITDKNLTMSNLNTSSSSLVTTPLLKSMSQIHLDLIRKSTSKSLLDEYTNTFNSKKTPMAGNRRTIGNIAMDIIRQRVENINRNVSFNQSMSEAHDDSLLAEPLNIEKTNDTPTTTTTTTTTANETKDAVNNEIDKPKPQGRRLFAPPSLFPDNSISSITATQSPSPPAAQQQPKTDKKTVPKSAPKRKRNELLSAEKPNVKMTVDDKKSKKPSQQRARRSTLFFEEAPIKKSTQKISSNTDQNLNETNESSDSTTAASKNLADKNTSPVMVCTSMHQPQIDFINEVRQC